MRDSCTRNDQQTRCSDWGKKTKKKAPVKSQWLHQSASSSTLFLLHGFLVILPAIKQAMRLASQYTGPPAYSGGKHQGIVSYDGEDRADSCFPLEYITYRLNCIQNEAQRQPQSGCSGKRRERPQSLGEESRGETESELMILKLGDCGLRWPRTPSEAAVRERCSV